MEQTHAPGWGGRPRRHADLIPIDADDPPLWLRRLDDIATLGCAIGAAICIASAIAAAIMVRL